MRAFDCLQQVSITFPNGWKDQFFGQKSWASLWLHDLLDQLRTLFFGLRNIRTDGSNLQTPAFDLFAITLHRRDDRHVPASLQLERHRHVGMNIAERTERVQGDVFWNLSHFTEKKI